MKHLIRAAALRATLTGCASSSSPTPPRPGPGPGPTPTPTTIAGKFRPVKSATAPVAVLAQGEIALSAASNSQDKAAFRLIDPTLVPAG